MALIVRVQKQEDQLCLLMTLELNEVVTLKYIEKLIYMVSYIQFVEQYTFGLICL